MRGWTMGTFGDRLKALREGKGMTQEGLARAAGVSVGTVSKLEQKGIDPSWSTVQKLAGALGVPVGDFATDGTGPQEAPGVPREAAGGGGGEPAPGVKAKRQEAGPGAAGKRRHGKKAGTAET
ncbi:MAG: helix-turn-helix domain-containing protein [Gaiellaceae bacterium]